MSHLKTPCQAFGMLKSRGTQTTRPKDTFTEELLTLLHYIHSLLEASM